MNTWTLWERIKLGMKDISFIISSILVLSLVVLAVLGPELAPHNPFVRDKIQWINGELLVAPMTPNSIYPLGTDAFGRDLLSLLLYGARQTLIMAIVATILRMITGLLLGMISGWNPGSLADRAISVVVDFLAAIPGLITALLLIYAVGVDRGQLTFIVALSVVGISEITQTMRGHVINVRSQGFIESARALGMAPASILSRHVLPNLFPSLLALTALQMGSVLLLLGELGFLGIYLGGGSQFSSLDRGVTRFFTMPEWGAMLGSSWNYMRSKPYLPLVPAIAFFISILSFNLFGNGLKRFIERGRFHPSGWSVLRLLMVIAVVLGGLRFLLYNSGFEAYYVDLAKQAKPERIVNDLKFLTDSDYGGRIAGTQGSVITAGYISNQFEAAGVTPQANGSYFQPYEGYTGQINTKPRLEVLDENGTVLLTITDGIAFNPMRPFHASQDREADFIIAANFTVQPEGGDYVFVLDPFERLPGYWEPRKYPGIFNVVPDEDLTLTDKPPAIATGATYTFQTPYLLIGESRMQEILTLAGLDMDDLETRKNTGNPLQEKTNLKIKLTVDVAYHQYDAYNVIGYLPAAGSGSSHRLVLAAPYTNPPSFSGGFHPNADENASGVAVMLEVIRILYETEYQPKNTIVFGAFDQGGGSQFSLRPILPTDSSDTWTVIVIDGIGAGEPYLARLETSGGYAATFDQSARRFGIKTNRMESWSAFPLTGGGYDIFLVGGTDLYSGLAITRPGENSLDSLSDISVGYLSDTARVILHLLMVLSS